MICVLGASFDTGNLGVNALAWSSLKLIYDSWPNAEICVLGAGREPNVYSFDNRHCASKVRLWPVRYTPKLWVQNHVFWIGFQLWLTRVFPFLRQKLKGNDTTLATLLRADAIFDITGGDSFSDIYGLRRIFQGYLLKRICQSTGKPFVLLPQTYGPFKSRLSRILARRVLSRSEVIYSRDKQGLAVVEELIGKSDKIHHCPDVAFVLDAIRPENEQVKQIEKLKAQGRSFIGLNISGLLYNGGYSKDNMFDLACDYRELVKELISYFVQQQEYAVMLVPHVIPKNFPVENDFDACRKVFQSLAKREKERTVVLDDGYDQNEIKYLIGQCDFFMGARMHSTIAALSQCVPSVGMAYSEKFAGVFQTVGAENSVIDMRKHDIPVILKRIQDIFLLKEDVKRHLTNVVPNIQKTVMSLFEDLEIK